MLLTNRQFPLELLQQSKEARLDYYEKYTMAHPHLDEALDMLKPIIRHSGESRVIFIFGPTGVGKTKLRLLAEKWVIEEVFAALETDRGCIPVGSVEVVLPKSGLFNAKDHLKRCLFALDEPKELVDRKIDYGVRGIRRNNDGQIVIESRILETDLGWALEQALKHRHPKIFFIDEAQDMLAVASGRKLTDAPEAIKSLANRTKVLHGLLGTYELLTLHDIGEQLSRRSVYIHIPRYDVKFTEDREIWQDVVWNFQLHIPTVEEPDFSSIWEYLYERSLGCVGILKNWFINALADALDEGANTITLKHLERRALSVGQCLNILKKIKEGEKRYTEIEGEVETLRKDLGFGLEPTSRTELRSKVAPKPTEEMTDSQGGKKNNKNVGQRRPKRDRVGVKRNVR
jgi:hypothetical protein